MALKNQLKIKEPKIFIKFTYKKECKSHCRFTLFFNKIFSFAPQNGTPYKIAGGFSLVSAEPTHYGLRRLLMRGENTKQVQIVFDKKFLGSR